MEKSYKICIIGLGYVGFPLACLFAKKYPVVAFDINTSRVKALQSGEDSTLEVSSERIAAALQNGMLCTDRVEDLKNCNIYIVTVPTPVNENNYPERQSQKELEYSHDAEKSQGGRRVDRCGNGIY